MRSHNLVKLMLGNALNFSVSTAKSFFLNDYFRLFLLVFRNCFKGAGLWGKNIVLLLLQDVLTLHVIVNRNAHER